jgi:hypothetical protein
MCDGNTVQGSSPAAFACTAPASLKLDALQIRGWSSELCCEVKGRCAGNSVGEPRFTCTAPQSLRRDAEMIRGW